MAFDAATTSFSQVDKFRRCQKAWEYRYKQGLKRKRRFVRMFKGNILHDMLDAHIRMKMSKGKSTNGDAWDVLDRYAEEYASYFEEERLEHGDIIGDCGKVFEGYLRKWRKDPLVYESSEESVRFDLPGKMPRFVGFIDKIATDPQGRRWIVDHKFMASIPSAEDRFSELQLVIYVWARNHTNPEEPIDGICWDYARSKAPTVPEVLKSGKGLTQRKNLDTDVYTYQQAIAENHFDPNDYIEMLNHLEGKENTFFERVFLPKPSKQMIEIVTEDFLQSTRDIQDKLKPKARCTRSMNTFNCRGCEFRPVCEAEVRGLDADFIIKSEYIQRDIGDK